MIGVMECGILAKPKCDMTDSTKKEYSEKKIFLDIPYSNYDDCEGALTEITGIAGLKHIVAKDKVTSKAMLCKICQLIKSCKYGIADISSGSNSVSYEYGIMHGFGMNVALLLREDNEKFSDIKGLEHLPYNGLRSLKIIVSKWILDNVEEADKEGLNNIIQKEEEELIKNGEVRLKKIKTQPEADGSPVLTTQDTAFPLVDIELARVKASPEFAQFQIQFAYDIILHSKSNGAISNIDVFRNIIPEKNRQKMMVHAAPQQKLTPFHKTINVLGPAERVRIYREQSSSYEFMQLIVIYRDPYDRKFRCTFEGDRDGLSLVNKERLDKQKGG